MRRPTTDSRLAVAYLRVSTDAEKQAHGLAIQRQAIARWAQERGIELVGAGADELSGRTAGELRPGLMRAMDLLAQTGAGLLVVHRIDRLARDTTEGLAIERALTNRGVDLVTVEGGGLADDPTGRLVRTITLGVAEFEGALIRARTAATKRRLRELGLHQGGSAPYGYRLEGRALVELPEEQAMLARLRELRASGLTTRATAAQLTAEGYRNRAGGHWSYQAVSRLELREPRKNPLPLPPVGR